ncbi:hypothetical protein HMPREF9944_01896 [Segatella maculosa OT 289]|uniref:Uncharacterized protein n=1 Tax=Segatella maculosa OT 289 TaxID=999422 RepID=H1HP02_9BACT|nr:hypothetical protein HMPREF9944_01896 [Segatella maculosa OT 289]
MWISFANKLKKIYLCSRNDKKGKPKSIFALMKINSIIN